MSFNQNLFSGNDFQYFAHASNKGSLKHKRDRTVYSSALSRRYFIGVNTEIQSPSISCRLRDLTPQLR